MQWSVGSGRWAVKAALCLCVSVVISLLALPAGAQTTRACAGDAAAECDTYGGLVTYHGVTAPTCTPGTDATDGHHFFTYVKNGNRWWYCTPEGHLFFANSTIAIPTNPLYDCRTVGFSWSLYSGTPGVDAIYSTSTTWPVDTLWQDWVDWGHKGTSLGKAASLAGITSAGQWYYDSAAKTLYVRLLGSDSPTAHVINAPQNTYNILIRKYGATSGNPAALNTLNYTWQQEKRMNDLGFNAKDQNPAGPWFTGDYACNSTHPDCNWPGTGTMRPNPLPRPYILQIMVGRYAAYNLNQRAPQPTKNIVWGLNGNYKAWRAALPDVFDDNLRQWWATELEVGAAQASWKTNKPWTLGVMVDDSDSFWGSGAGPDFVTSNPSPNVGWLALAASPLQTYIQTTHLTNKTVVYPDPLVYTKMQATSPTTACSVTNPCSLRDFLWQKYTQSGALTDAQGIAALNAAWGSNYTTFDSTGTQITGEELCAGEWNGSKTVCTKQLDHALVSPHSVQLTINDTVIGGDCPWFHNTLQRSDGNCQTTTVNLGTLGTPTALGTASAANWSNGAASYTFTLPLPPLTVGAPLTTTGFAPAGYNVTNARITSVDRTTGVVQIAMAASPGAVSTRGSATSVYLNQPASTVNYATGAATVTFAFPPPSGASVKLNYTYGGWMAGGTGLVDEDGNYGGRTWIPSNYYCLTGPSPDFPAYQSYFLCNNTGGYHMKLPTHSFPIANTVVTGGTAEVTTTANHIYNTGQTVYITLTSVAACNQGPVVITKTAANKFTFPAGACTNSTGGWVNGALPEDMDDFVTQLSAQYFKDMAGEFKKKSQLRFLGLDIIGGWGVTAHRGFLEGAAPYLDSGFIGLWSNSSDRQLLPAMWQYTTRYLGDIPMENSTVPETLDGGMYCSGRVSEPSQEARGQGYRDTLDTMLNTPSYNGTYQLTRQDFWEWQDGGSYWEPFGITSVDDNLYDGWEAGTGGKKCGCTAADPNCSTPLYTVQAGQENSCGGESYDYGDGATYVRQAATLWMAAAAGSESTPSAAAPIFGPAAGTYSSVQSVTLGTSTSGASICYTTDGSTPTANGSGTCTHGTTYTGAVAVAASLTLKAIASAAGYLDSAVSTAVYTIELPPGPSVSTTVKGATVKGTVIQ